ncbi:hypothetical protein N7448_010973 [Penicillium atrosanguineum]|nr:hypothetical protein N7448_010973 [Penicillium atrosanguineum]
MQLVQILRNNTGLAMPNLNPLDLHLCLWDYCIVKSAEKIHLDEEEQLREPYESLEVENNLFVQRYNEQVLLLRGREHVLRDLHIGGGCSPESEP